MSITVIFVIEVRNENAQLKFHYSIAIKDIYKRKLDAMVPNAYHLAFYSLRIQYKHM